MRGAALVQHCLAFHGLDRSFQGFDRQERPEQRVNVLGLEVTVFARGEILHPAAECRSLAGPEGAKLAPVRIIQAARTGRSCFQRQMVFGDAGLVHLGHGTNGNACRLTDGPCRPRRAATHRTAPRSPCLFRERRHLPSARNDRPRSTAFHTSYCHVPMPTAFRKRRPRRSYRSIRTRCRTHSKARS